MVWQADGFEMRTKCAVVAIGDRQKYYVADWFFIGIRPFARLNDLEVFAFHKRSLKGTGSQSRFGHQEPNYNSALPNMTLCRVSNIGVCAAMRKQRKQI